nr:LysR family transcriptional regulator substrate-binding protein [Shewanella gelidimarina]
MFLPISQFVDLASHIEDVSLSEPLESPTEVLRVAVSPGLICFVARSLYNLPSLKFELLNWDENSPERLHNGEIDLGLCLGKQQTKNLETEVIGTIKNLCVVGNDKHPIWDMNDPIILEDLSKHPFVYQEIKGFNDKVDPFEVFCQKEGVKLTSTHKVIGLETLYAHLLTMKSLAIESSSECDVLNSLPGIRSERMALDQAKRLLQSMVSPDFYIIERESKYRKYSQSVRSELCNIISKSIDL